MLRRRLAGVHTSAYVMMLRMRLAEYCTQFFLLLNLSDLLSSLNVCVCVCVCVCVVYLPPATGMRLKPLVCMCVCVYIYTEALAKLARL